MSRFAPGPYRGPQRRNPPLVDANKLAQTIAEQIYDFRWKPKSTQEPSS